jgi:hypothetical protein
MRSFFARGPRLEPDDDARNFRRKEVRFGAD